MSVVAFLGEAGSEEGQLNLPVGITTDAEGDLWVANYFNHHVQQFSPEGELLTQFGEVGEEPGQLKNPTRIAVDSEGNLWVADSGNDRVQKFSPEGEYLEGFGETGSEEGQLDFPSGIAIDAKGNLWVVDRENSRVQSFTPAGEYLTGFGEEGTGPAQFKVPTGIAIDPDGNIWVADYNDRVQGFNAKGEYISSFGEEGEGEGQLDNPEGIALAAEGRVWVADRSNHRVSGWDKTVSTTTYIQGAHGLVEQRSAGETSYPLPDAHGDITAIADPAGEVTSRQSYDPWGTQLSGPTEEMGFLGSQQRRTDPMSGLIQMGARSYAPELGRFLSEDPVLGHLGVGMSFDRYAYVWDNPLNLYDLDGQDVCVPTPFGGTCAGDVAEDLGSLARAGGRAAWDRVRGNFDRSWSIAEKAWDLTAPNRQWVADRANDFFKFASTHTWGLCFNGYAGAAAGINGQVCIAGNIRNVGFTASRGAGAFLPGGAGIGIGPLFSNASRNAELAGPAAYGGIGARPGAGPTATLNGTYGLNRGGGIYTANPSVGLSVGPAVTTEAGISWTGAESLEW